MRQGILAIYDSDVDYSNQLMDYLNRKGDFILHARLFTKEESLLDYGRSNTIDILLLSEEDISNFNKPDNIKHIILLTEGQYIKEETIYPTIYKYQSIDKIISEVLTYYVDNVQELSTKKLLIESKSIKLISVFSPMGSNTRATFSYHLAHAYSTEKKTLYLNLELFSALSILTEQQSSKGLSDLIYFLKNDNSNIILKLNTLIQRIEQLDYLPCAQNGFDLYELDKDNMNQFLHQLRTISDYEIVIIDVGYINKAILELFDFSNVIYIITDGTSISQEQNQQFIQLLELEKTMEVKEKLMFLNISYEDFYDSNGYAIQDLIEHKIRECIGDIIRESV